MSVDITTPTGWVEITTIQRNGAEGVVSEQIGYSILLCETPLATWHLHDYIESGLRYPGWQVELFPARQTVSTDFGMKREGCWLKRATNPNRSSQVDETLVGYDAGLREVNNFLRDNHPKG